MASVTGWRRAGPGVIARSNQVVVLCQYATALGHLRRDKLFCGETGQTGFPACVTAINGGFEACNPLKQRACRVAGRNRDNLSFSAGLNGEKGLIFKRKKF